MTPALEKEVILVHLLEVDFHKFSWIFVNPQKSILI